MSKEQISRKSLLEAIFVGGLGIAVTACAEQDNAPVSSNMLLGYLNPIVDHFKKGQLPQGVEVKRDPKTSEVTTTYTKDNTTITIKSNYFITTGVRLESTTNDKKMRFEYLLPDPQKNIWNISTTVSKVDGSENSSFNTTGDFLPLRTNEFEEMRRKGKDIFRNFIK